MAVVKGEAEKVMRKKKRLALRRIMQSWVALCWDDVLGCFGPHPQDYPQDSSCRECGAGGGGLL